MKENKNVSFFSIHLHPPCVDDCNLECPTPPEFWGNLFGFFFWVCVYLPFFGKYRKIHILLVPETTILKWMFGETTISYVKNWNHPIETTTNKWMFEVPGCTHSSWHCKEDFSMPLSLQFGRTQLRTWSKVSDLINVGPWRGSRPQKTWAMKKTLVGWVI